MHLCHKEGCPVNENMMVSEGGQDFWATLLSINGQLLTGTMRPCHDKRFDSSTWMFLKFFIPDLRISSSS